MRRENGNPTWHFTKDIIVLPTDTPPTPTPTYTVTYLPGEQGNFTPQEYSGLYAGDVTPVFNGTPTGNPNWNFNGWQPEISETVTADATYTAQWTYRDSGNILADTTVTAAFFNHKSVDTEPSSPKPTTPEPSKPEPTSPDSETPTPIPTAPDPTAPIDPDMPKTGNTFHGFAWLGLLLFSGISLVAVIRKRHRRNENDDTRS